MAHQRSPASQLHLSNALSLFKSSRFDKAEEMARKVLASALFDTGRFARNLEAAYEAMWQLWRDGQAPRAIDLSVAT